MDSVIRVEGLGKKYLIRDVAGSERYATLRDSIAEISRNLLRAGSSMIRKANRVPPGGYREFWALRDISFDVGRGETIGIIGLNGAGKSTLLKILSRITEPTSGRAVIAGRVASLLEVGTGFHPELTGRENIYLNGAILGMARAEVRAKFDEIVAFSGVEKFLETPVKHYSSGMYVRLAFAVAAHLEPDILIIDEVLAVGDAEFQKKCLGKISNVARSGRTVLFVSHNMSAIRGLTSRVLYLRDGALAFDGGTEEGVRTYADRSQSAQSRSDWGKGIHTRILRVDLQDERGNSTTSYMSGDKLRVAVEIETDGSPGLSLEVFLLDAMKTKIGMVSLQHFHGLSLPNRPGSFRCVLTLPPMWLASGTYGLEVATSVPNVTWDHYVTDALEFEGLHQNPLRRPFDFRQEMGYGAMALIPAEPIAFEALEDKPPRFALDDRGSCQ